MRGDLAGFCQKPTDKLLLRFGNVRLVAGGRYFSVFCPASPIANSEPAIADTVLAAACPARAIEGNPCQHHFPGMPRRARPKATTRLLQQWPLAPAATLGSSVRARGILLEVRAQLAFADRKLIDVETGAIVMRVPADDEEDHAALADTVTRKLVGIEDLPIIPREVEDILSIKTAERHRWLKDGRLQSAGTRTVKLRGRARKITFHVFNPRHIEDVLDRNLPDIWREEDALAAAENRRRGRHKAALKKAGKLEAKKKVSGKAEKDETALKGWDDFDLDGLLR